jgi:hypothetical protein
VEPADPSLAATLRRRRGQRMAPERREVDVDASGASSVGPPSRGRRTPVPEVDARWDELTIPAGWEPVATVARTVTDELDALTERIVAHIRTELSPYRSGLVPEDDLARSVRSNLRITLLGLAEHRGPTPAEVAGRRPLGTQRAIQGMPIDAVIQAYHVGYRELWSSLVAAVPDGDQHTATLLLTAATTVWQWTHEATAAIAAQHASTVQSAEARMLGARQRFLEVLAAGDLDDPEAEQLGFSLGFDPRGRFVATVVRSGDDLDAVALQHALEAEGGQHAAVTRGRATLVLSQDADLGVVIEEARRSAPGAAIGCGSPRLGLRGARASLEDADRTLAVTPDGETGRFEEAWLWATLAGARDRLLPLLAVGQRVAAEHPHLAAAVVGYADGRFSVSEAARRLGLHANTVAYRLDRWHELTGWDPRSFAGLSRSLAALRLS